MVLGVDVKCLYRVVHFGPPANISSYIQESGRAGRDGLAADAIIIKYRGIISWKKMNGFFVFRFF